MAQLVGKSFPADRLTAEYTSRHGRGDAVVSSKEHLMAHVEFQCRHCEKRLRMSDEHVGKTVRCPACKETFVAALAVPRGGLDVASSKTSASQDHAPERDPAPVSRPRRSTPAGKPASESSTGARPAKTRSRPSGKSVRPPQEEETWDDDASQWDESQSYVEGYDDLYAATSQPGRARRKKSELPGKLLRAGLFVVLALIAMGTVGGLGYLAITHLPRLPGLSGNVVDMAWLPENVDGFAYFEPAAIAESPFAKAIERKVPQQPFSKVDNVSIADIDTILIGFWQDDGASVELPAPLLISPWGIGDSHRATDFLGVATLNKDVPSAFGMEKKAGEYKGVALYGSGGKLSCMPDSRTMLIGSDRSVKAAIDGNGKEFTHSKFQFARGSGNVVIAALRTSTPSSSLSKKSSFPTTSIPPGSPFDASRKVGELLDQHTRGGYLVVNVGTRVDFSGGVLCNDDAGAASLDQELKTVLDNGKKQIESLKSIAAVSAMSVPLISVMDSLVVSRSGATVSVSGTVEQSLIDALPSSGMTPAAPFGSPGSKR